MSYSPLYKQEVLWVAEYLDNSILREFDDDGKPHLFKEIDKSKLKKFHLISADNDYFFDCKTGVFTIEDKNYVFPLAGMNLSYAEGLIHFKNACTEFVPEHLKTHTYDGFEITDYEFGWKVTHGNIKSQVIFSFAEKSFRVEITFLDIQKTVSWKVNI